MGGWGWKAWHKPVARGIAHSFDGMKRFRLAWMRKVSAMSAFCFLALIHVCFVPVKLACLLFQTVAKGFILFGATALQ